MVIDKVLNIRLDILFRWIKEHALLTLWNMENPLTGALANSNGQHEMHHNADFIRAGY